MPYKSEAQRGYMHAAAERGDIPAKVVREFDKASIGLTDLPQYVKDKRGRRAVDGEEVCPTCGAAH
jgi:hypothetical protein